jgi:xanthine dehydrogenase accessory factor
MNETLAHIVRWQEMGQPVATATVVHVSGSAPRPIGSRLIVTADAEFAGSVSGGCVENAVIEESLAVLRDGRPRLVHYGITSEMAWEIGLACGGQLDVFIQPADPGVWRQLGDLTALELPCALLSIIGEGEEAGAQAVVVPGEPSPEFPAPEALSHALALLAGKAGPIEPTLYTLGGQEVLIEPFLPPPQLIIFGGVDAAGPLSDMAQIMGFQTIIVDPRRAFANRERFPDADQVLVLWPSTAFDELAVDARTAIVILTHDPKIDEPALVGALKTPAFYIGAIGSRKTHAARAERLVQAGAVPESFRRIHGPIGLDLGGRSIQELALSILSEIIAVRNGRPGGILTAS